MLNNATIRNILKQRDVWILDGAMGTLLEKEGYRTSLPLWTGLSNLQIPDRIRAHHQAYLRAGATILTANTFRCSYYLFEKAGMITDHAAHLEAAAFLARSAIREEAAAALVAASVTVLEDCYRPDLAPYIKELRHFHSLQMNALATFDFDFILAETIPSAAEALVIAEIADDQEIPFMMSFVTDNGINLLDGTPLVALLEEMSTYRPLAVLINCRSVEGIAMGVETLIDFDGDFLIGCYPNAPGHPDTDYGWQADPDADEIFAQFMSNWVAKGCQIVGGCCGTTPEMIKALSSDLWAFKRSDDLGL